MPEHGGSRYAMGCRCSICRRAKAEYMQALRLRLVEHEPPPEAHGKETTYNNWSCRCEACCAAKAECNRRRYLAREERANAS